MGGAPLARPRGRSCLHSAPHYFQLLVPFNTSDQKKNETVSNSVRHEVKLGQPRVKGEQGGGGRGVGGHLARAGIQERRQCVDYRELG